MIKGKILNNFGGEYGTYVTDLDIDKYLVFDGFKLLKVFANIEEFIAWANKKGFTICDGIVRT